MVPLGPREPDYDVLVNTCITADTVRALAEAADACWSALLARDLPAFGAAVRASYEAQVAMFPAMRTPLVDEVIARYKGRCLGYKLSGAGGGGYLVLVADGPVEGGFCVTIRRGG
mgnify:CR=1 FL=1